MTPDVGEAVDELRQAFPGSTVTAVEDANGGAYVTVDSVDTGGLYTPETTWMKFHITFQYPYSDVYPHFVDPSLQRRDGMPLGDGFQQPVPFVGDGLPATQISRVSRNLNPSVDTAALKLVKVLHWMGNR